jgi:hypothetical protein
MLAAGAFAMLAVSSAGPQASAQNALGDGRALDRNSRVGSGGVNQRSSTISNEVRFRNAIVTGNAPGGMSFRGSVGYTSPFDFRGELGSDDIFRFSRDSYFSGLAASPAARTFRSVDALSFQMEVSMHGVAGRATGFEPTMGRGVASSNRQDNLSVDATAPLSRLYEPLLTRPGALRSTSQFITGDALAPTVMGRAVDEEGNEIFAVASPLRSVKMQETITPRRSIAPNLISQSVTSLDPDSENVDNTMSNRIESTKITHDSIMQGIRDARTAREAARIEAEIEANDESSLREQMLRGDATSEEIEEAAREALESGDNRVDLLAPADPERDIFGEHMERGQEMLQAGRWFEAEERFTSATAMRPGDPIPAVGRVHAQLGAGLYRSAAENLKTLFRNHPEMIAARFDATLLPNNERLQQVRVQLRDLARGESEFARGSALLLAYLGNQYENIRDIEAAFEEIDRVSAVLGDTPDPVYVAARAVWLPEDDTVEQHVEEDDINPESSQDPE